MPDGADTQTIHRTLRHSDTVIVRDENGVVVVQIRNYGERVRQAITFPAGGSVEHNGQQLTPPRQTD